MMTESTESVFTSDGGEKIFAAFGTALVAGYVAYEVVNLQWESLLPFPIITGLSFVFLIQQESPREAVGTGLYIIAAFLLLWAVHYAVSYQDIFAAVAGPNIFFAIGAFIVIWIVLMSVGVAVLGLRLNQST